MTSVQLIGLLLVILAILGFVAVWTIVVLYLRRLDRPVVAVAGAGWGVQEEHTAKQELASSFPGPVPVQQEETQWLGWGEQTAAEDDWFADEDTQVLPACEDKEAVCEDQETVVVPAFSEDKDREEVDAGWASAEERDRGGEAAESEGDDGKDRESDIQESESPESESPESESPESESSGTVAGADVEDGIHSAGAEGAEKETSKPVEAAEQSDDESSDLSWDDQRAGDENTKAEDDWFGSDGAPASGDDPFAVDDQQSQPRKKRRRFGF